MSFRSSSASAPELSWLVPLLICAAILLAHSPVLFNTYLRQDDWTAAMWNRHFLKTHPDLYNAAVELFRPVSVIITLFADALNYHMEYAWIARLMTLFAVCATGIATYRWQRLLGIETVFAACFAVCACIIPSAQLQTSTGCYLMMPIPVLLSQLAAFRFHRGFREPAHRLRDYALGEGLLFLSLLTYPLSTTYILVFLTIYFLRNPEERWWRHDSFLFQATALTLLSMVALLLAAKLVYFAFHVVPHNPARAIAFDWDIPNKILYWFNMLVQAANLYDVAGLMPGSVAQYMTWQLPLALAAFLALGVFCRRKVLLNHPQLSASEVAPLFLSIPMALLVITGFLTLAFSPAFPLHYNGSISFRYLLVIAPIALYTLFWSLEQIADCLRMDAQRFALCCCILTLALTMLCAHNLTRYIAGLDDYEISYIRGAIEREALATLRDGKPVTIYIKVATDYNTHQNHSHEYGFSIANFSSNYLFAAVVYVMRDLGYESIEKDPTIKILDWKGNYVRAKTRWGYIYATASDVPHIPVPPDTKEVDIDMENALNY